MYRIIATFLIILASIFLSPSQSEAQISVALRDTSITRGSLSVIPIYGDIPSDSDGNLELSVRFNAYVIDIKRIVTDASTSLNEQHTFSVDLTNIESSSFNVFTDDYIKPFSGVLFYLEVEGLAGPDTATLVSPIAIKIGGVEQQAEFDSGTISVQSIPVGPKLTEGLGQNFPNPFNVYTEIFFSVDSDSKVSFKIFSLSGRNVFSQGIHENTFATEIYDDSGNQIDNYLEHTFTAGRYRMRLTPASWEISAGAYYLVMAVQDQVYKTNFIYYK
ncbi:MAG: hypothetical protein M9949_14815 [Candidatus Kapabacteria bacterium]|nr:hypothetical protein [Candidatus Kapabacteria bacterium]